MSGGLLGAALSLLAGCGPISGDMGTAKAPVVLPGVVTGRVHGGQQPVANATIQLWQVGTTGYGLGAAPLGGSSQTNAGGQFNLATYSCANAASGGDTPVYVTANGGNPGLGPGTNNLALSMMVAMGSCKSITASTFIDINEVTTIGTVFSLAQFMSPSGGIGSYGASSQGLLNAFATVNNLVDVNHGKALSLTPNANGIVPQAEINTLGDILSPCINSPGPSSPSCHDLFAATTPSGGAAPTTTLAAALNIALNPGNNVTALLNLAPAAAPFQPTVSATNDWTIAIGYASGGVSPAALGVDGAGNVWVANKGTGGGTSSLSLVSPLGVAAANSPYSNAGQVNGAVAVAIDVNNNLWLANHDNSSVTEFAAGSGSLAISPVNAPLSSVGLSGPDALGFDPAGNLWVANNSNNSVTEIPAACTSTACATTVTGGGLNDPRGIALDSGGNAWVTNHSGASVTRIPVGGAPAPFNGGGLTSPSGIAIDGSTNVWVTDSGLPSVTELNSNGAALSPGSGLTGGGLTAANAVAIDGNGGVWVADAGSNQLSLLSSAGVPLTPSSGFQGGALSAPSGVGIDASGNVWVANSSPVTLAGLSITLTEFVGAGAPTVSPLAVAVKTGQLGGKPGVPLQAKPPTANAGGPYAATAGNAIAFSGVKSSDPKGEALGFTWSFGDGASASGAAPTHVYLTAGTYAVSLTVTNTDGLSATATTSAVVAGVVVAPPVANAGGPYSGTAFAPVQFSGVLSSDPGNPGSGSSALTFAWSFGDGTQGAGPSPIHTYNGAGTFPVSLTVQSTSSGETATASSSAVIAAGTAPAGAPTAQANGPYSAAAGAAVNFSSAGSSDRNGLTLTYVWIFGDGSSATDANPSHIYGVAGTYSVSLTVSNGTSHNSSSSLATISPPPPLAAILVKAGGPYSVAVNQPLQLSSGGTTNPATRQLTYTWDFGDGTMGMGINPIHTYSQSGRYTVSLNVNDGATENGNATAAVTVTGPAAEAVQAVTGGPYQDTVGQTITFDGTGSTDNLHNALTYSWDFGDGTSGSGATPTHAYATVGKYTATLTVTSGTASSSASTLVPVTPVITVKITSPQANAIYATASVTVTGTLSAPNLTVTVNGTAATVSGMTFTATGVSLREGVNQLSATATDGQGGVGTGVVSVICDVTAPTVSITSPAASTTLTQSSVAVAGLVNDSVTGTIGSNDVSVTVNGQPAQVANRSYLLSNLQLVPGSNTISVTATDKVGNTSTTTETVKLLPATSQLSIQKISGDNQSGAIKSVLANPLVVQLVAASGSPVAGRPITFTVTRSDGIVEVLPTTGQALSVTTDATGKASVLFQLGSRSGLGINQVSASTPGAGGAALFTQTSTAGAPAIISEVIGQNQRGLLGEPLAQALQVIVKDASNNPVTGVTVNYAMNGAGDGTLDTPTVVTDSNGRAIANLTLGQQEGISNYSVTADFSGDAGPPVTFVASAYAPGPVTSTKVSGTVLDTTLTPVANATVTVAGTTLRTVTNTDGNFTISGAPVGTVTLTVDGSTATTTKTLPFLSFVLQDLPGQNNTVGKPIYLPVIDVNDAQTVGSTDPVTLTMAGVPGLAFTIAPNSVTFPDGSTVGKLSISQVKSDQVPMEPSNGSAPNLVWTLQPAGTRFSVPVQVTLPNTQALPPGYVTELFQYDHDLEQFVTAGTAHVSADGSVLVSDPGFGITKAGWGHGGSPPAQSSCTQSCGLFLTPCIQTVPAGNCTCKISFLSGRACGRSASALECHFPGKCKNGICDAPPLANGTSCGLGTTQLCTTYACASGQCAATTIPDQPQGSLPGSNKGVNVQLTLDKVASATQDFLKKLGANLEVRPTVQAYDQVKLVCCEATQMQNVPLDVATFSGGLAINAPEFPLRSPFPPFAPLAIDIPHVGPQGLFGQLGGTVEVGMTRTDDQCAKKDCYGGFGKLGITLTGFFAIGDPQILQGKISLASGFSGTLAANCQAISASITFEGLTATAQITLLDLVNYQYAFQVLNSDTSVASYTF